MKRLMLSVFAAAAAIALLAACHGPYSIGYEVHGHGHGHWRHRSHHWHHPHHGHHFFYAVTVGH